MLCVISEASYGDKPLPEEGDWPFIIDGMMVRCKDRVLLMDDCCNCLPECSNCCTFSLNACRLVQVAYDRSPILVRLIFTTDRPCLLVLVRTHRVEDSVWVVDNCQDPTKCHFFLPDFRTSHPCNGSV